MTLDSLRRRPRRYGAGLVALGFVALLALRFVASPIGRRILGQRDVGVVAFLAIPVFLGIVALGIAVFLLEPDDGSDG